VVHSRALLALNLRDFRNKYGYILTRIILYMAHILFTMFIIIDVNPEIQKEDFRCPRIVSLKHAPIRLIRPETFYN